MTRFCQTTCWQVRRDKGGIKKKVSERIAKRRAAVSDEMKETARKKRSRAIMSDKTREAVRKTVKEQKNRKRIDAINEKCKHPAGFDFVIHDKNDLAQKMIDIRHDLGGMSYECCYCKGKGFECEVKGESTNPDNPGEKC